MHSHSAISLPIAALSNLDGAEASVGQQGPTTCWHLEGNRLHHEKWFRPSRRGKGRGSLNLNVGAEAEERHIMGDGVADTWARHGACMHEVSSRDIVFVVCSEEWASKVAM